MATETFHYFRAESVNLRADYGGAAIQAGGDSREIDGNALTLRHLCKKLGKPANGTRYLWEIGVATDTFYWIKVSDVHWAAISAELTANELASVTTSPPAGWTKATIVYRMQPSAVRKVLLARGTSITFGLGTTTGDTRDTWMAQLINSIAGETLVWLDAPNYTEGNSDNFQLLNMSLGGSSWANTNNSTGGENGYPHREDLAYNQRTKTLPLFNPKIRFVYSLGTNDGAYDASVDGAAIWARAAARVAAFKADFPNVPVGLETIYKRDTSNPATAGTLNNRLDAANALARANYKTAGFSRLFDSEAKVSQINMITGDPTNTADYTDKIHVTTLTHGRIAAAHKQDMIDWFNTP